MTGLERKVRSYEICEFVSFSLPLQSRTPSLSQLLFLILFLSQYHFSFLALHISFDWKEIILPLSLILQIILYLLSSIFFIHISLYFNQSLSTSFSFSFTCFSLSQELQLWAHQHLHMPRHPLDTDFCYHRHRQIRWTLLHYHFGDHLGPVRILYLADLKECEGGKERREKRRKET